MAKDNNSEAAKKVADAEKSSKKKAAKKDGQPNVFARLIKKIGQFFKDLKGETKKIIWPDAKTVWKSTGVVIACVLIIGIGIWLVDLALSKGIDAVLAVEITEKTSTTQAAETTAQLNQLTTAAEGISSVEETSAAEEVPSEEGTTAAVEETSAAAEETTTAAATTEPATETTASADESSTAA